MVVFNILNIINNFKLNEDRINNIELTNVKFCSTLKVKGIYISNNLYNINNIP